MIISNPSAFLYRIRDSDEILNALASFKVKVGEAETEHGPRDREASALDSPTTVPFSSGKIIKEVQRGNMLFEESRKIGFLKKFDTIDDYYFRYYVFETSFGPLLGISAKKKVSQHIARVLLNSGHFLQNLNLGRRVQDEIMRRSDITDWGTRIQDEVDPDIRVIDIRARTTTTSLRHSPYSRQADQRGRDRDMSFTVEETKTRHRLTFTVRYTGSIYVMHPQVQEEWFLEIIDLVLQAV